MTKHIGIVAASPEGAALFHRQISRHASEVLEPREHPRITVHNEPLASYVDAIGRDDWHEVGDLLRHSAELLARCGADFCMTPDNAVQHGVHLAEVGSPIPWVTMVDFVAEALARDERGVVGLIGTRLVTTGSTYQTTLGLRGVQVLVPERAEIEDLDRIIFQELVYGRVEARSVSCVREVISRLAERGCEGVILGCSEGRLLVSEDVSPIPVYDTVDLLAHGAVRHAMAD
jgi:aspartate racemase